MRYRIKAGVDIDQVSNFNLRYAKVYDIDLKHVWPHPLYGGKPSVSVKNGRSVVDEIEKNYDWIYMEALEPDVDYEEFFYAL